MAVWTLMLASLVSGNMACADPRIFADADVRISYDGDVSHMEAPIAASVSEPDLEYVISELSAPGPSSVAYPQTFGRRTQIYYTHYAGAHWDSVPLRREWTAQGGGWDNAIAAGLRGDAYAVSHGASVGGGLAVFRTHDAGRTWRMSRIDSGRGSWDREYVALDSSTGGSRGRLYVAGEHVMFDKDSGERRDDGVYLVTSTDGGVTFSKPVLACRPPLKWAAAMYPKILILSHGTVVIPCHFYPTNRQEYERWSVRRDFGVAVSTDGGRSFSRYRSVGNAIRLHTPVRTVQMSQRGDFLAAGDAQFASAPAGARFPDRIYAVWSTWQTDVRSVVLESHSDDYGRHWSRPVRVERDLPRGRVIVRQVQPAIAVNATGVVGVAWFDGRNVPGAAGYDVYFTASLDGGESFLSAVRLSSASSHPRSGGSSVIPNVASEDSAGAKILSFLPPADLRPIGGDYSSMAVDAVGGFHPIWPDARDGTWQLYTSTVRVVEPPAPAGATRDCDLSKDVRMVAGVPRWNAKARELSLEVQLQNRSPEAIVGPLTVRINGKADPNIERIYGRQMARQFPPARVLTSVIEYPLSVTYPLFPDGVTPRAVWRFHVDSVLNMQFNMEVHIWGRSVRCSIKKGW